MTNRILLILAMLAMLAIGTVSLVQHLSGQSISVGAPGPSTIGLNQLPSCQKLGPGSYLYGSTVPQSGPPQVFCIAVAGAAQFQGSPPSLVLPSLTPISMTYGEIPGGTIDGNNTTFTLATAPNPAASLQIFRNGISQTPSTDYTLSGSTITFAVAPAAGDILAAMYRTQ